ncbi:MAG TPA: Spy/CpxP family protein refolding chaperone [Sunxiuqinia sp.]|nr:Spy/CpxP family protein refolding chaperone [Sunxiuqinia sp.]
MKNKLGGLFLILALVIGTTAYAQQQEPVRKKHFKHQQLAENHRMGEKFGQSLTDEQKEAFKGIRMKSMKEAKPLRDQLRELKAHQQTLMTADQPDLDAIYNNIDKMSDLQTQLAKIRAKTRIDMQAQLTDEQKIEFQHMRKMRKHHQNSGFNPGRFKGDRM